MKRAWAAVDWVMDVALGVILLALNWNEVTKETDE